MPSSSNIFCYTHPTSPSSSQPVCLNHPLGTCHKMPLSFMSSWAPGCKVLKGKNHENSFQSFFILTWHLSCYKCHCILGKLSLVRQVSPGAGVTGVGDGRQESKTAEDMVWVGGLCWAGQGGAGKQLQMLSSSWGPLETENTWSFLVLGASTVIWGFGDGHMWMRVPGQCGGVACPPPLHLTSGVHLSFHVKVLLASVSTPTKYPHQRPLEDARFAFSSGKRHTVQGGVSHHNLTANTKTGWNHQGETPY